MINGGESLSNRLPPQECGNSFGIIKTIRDGTYNTVEVHCGIMLVEIYSRNHTIKPYPVVSGSMFRWGIDSIYRELLDNNHISYEEGFTLKLKVRKA